VNRLRAHWPACLEPAEEYETAPLSLCIRLRQLGRSLGPLGGSTSHIAEGHRPRASPERARPHRHQCQDTVPSPALRLRR
jgi:hypothetical protein